MVESLLEKRLRRLPREPVPASPWLEHHVIEVLRREVSTRKATRSEPGVWPTMAGLAAMLIAALVVGILVGSHLNAPRPAGPPIGVEPSRDAAIVRYRTRIDVDMYNIDRAFAAIRCDSRDRCLLELARTRTAAKQLDNDMSRLIAPEAVSRTATRTVTADAQFIAQLDAAMAIIAQPNSDYVMASGIPDVSGLDIAAAYLDCWPAVPVQGEHGLSCS